MVVITRSVMRDDVHRRAPVPARWRALLKVCRNEASSRQRGEAAARRILETTLRDGLPPAFRLALAEATDSRQLSLTGAQDFAERCRGAGLARDVAVALQVVRPSGAIRTEDVVTAVCAATQTNVGAHLRELDAYLATEAPRGRRATMDRIRGSFENANLRRLAEAVAQGQKLTVTRGQRNWLDIDEDIR